MPRKAQCGRILLPGYSLQKSAHRIELRSETRPVSGFQAIDRSIVVVKCLARPIHHGTCELRFRCNTRGRWHSAVCEERRQCLGERLLHYHMIAIGGDHALELRQLSLFRPQIKRRYIENRVLDRDPSKFPRITREPIWFHSESCWEI